MRKLEATIKPFKLDATKDALCAIGVRGLTISEVRGFGSQRPHAELHLGRVHLPEFTSRVKVEVVVSDELARQVVETIRSAAKTGRAADGKILVQSVDEVIRIRTGEREAQAL